MKPALCLAAMIPRPLWIFFIAVAMAPSVGGSPRSPGARGRISIPSSRIDRLVNCFVGEDLPEVWLDVSDARSGWAGLSRAASHLRSTVLRFLLGDGVRVLSAMTMQGSGADSVTAESGGDSCPVQPGEQYGRR